MNTNFEHDEEDEDDDEDSHAINGGPNGNGGNNDGQDPLDDAFKDAEFKYWQEYDFAKDNGNLPLRYEFRDRDRSEFETR